MPRLLPDDALKLLPDPGSTPRCSDFSQELMVDPGGTAIDAAVVILVETPLPWPKPVFNHELLSGLESTPDLFSGRARVLAAVPRSEGRIGAVHAWVRDDDGRVTRVKLIAETNTELLELMNELETVPVHRSSFVTNDTLAEAAVLICTQGSHDICCGSAGTRLAMEADIALPGVDVFGVSHTGGHRFAPTAMTLPDGRMWSYLDLKVLDGILRRQEDPTRLVSQCRGWWGAERGPAQLAERAVFGHLGWAADDRRRLVRLMESNSASEPIEQRWVFEVECGDDVWIVTVGVRRVVPTIACRALGGMPAKPGMEYVVIAGPEGAVRE